MFNKLKFKATVIEHGKTLSDVAKCINVNTSTLYRKMNGETEFSRKEIQEICTFLELESPTEIFFAKELT